MARNLEADRAMLARVLAYAQNREIGRAAAIAEQALAEGFEHPLLLNVMATYLEEQGKLEEAVRLLERAVTLAPGDVPARNALALCLQRVDRPADAAKVWRSAIDAEATAEGLDAQRAVRAAAAELGSD